MSEEVEVIHNKNLVLAPSPAIGSFMANRLGLDPSNTGIIVDPLAVVPDNFIHAENVYAIYSKPNEVVSEEVLHMLSYMESFGYNIADITYL